MEVDDEGYTSPAENESPCPIMTSHNNYPAKSPTCFNSWDHYSDKNFSEKLKKSFISSNDDLSSKITDAFWKVSIYSANELSNVSNWLTIPFTEFISNVFHLLSGRESKSFNFNTSSASFELGKNLAVSGLSPTAIKNFSKDLIVIGNSIRLLSSITSIESLSENLVLKAFKSFVADYLKLYETFLMIKKESISTMTEIVQMIQPFKNQIEVLMHIYEVGLNKSSVEFLLEIKNILVSCENIPVEDLVRSIYSCTAAAYMKHISNWIFCGELSNRASEFHIKSEKVGILRDRRFWTSQFSETENIPEFILSSRQSIFETGKALTLLNLIKKDHKLFVYDKNDLMKPALSFESLIELYNYWSHKLSLFLSQNSQYILKSSEETFDFESANQVRSQFEMNHKKMVQNSQLTKQAKQKSYLNSLDMQVEEKKERKKINLERDKIEEVERTSFNERKRKQSIKEKDEFNFKYFQIGEKKNVEVIEINDEEKEKEDFEKTNPGSEHLSQFAEPEITPLKCPEEKILPKIQSLNKNENKTEVKKSTVTRKRNFNKKEGKKIEELLDFKREHEKNKTNEISEEIKIDLKKLITKEFEPLSLIDERNFKTMENVNKLKREDKYQVTRTSDAYSINLFLAHSVAIPLRFQQKMVNAALLHYFITEQKLFEHILGLNNFLLLQNGLFAQFLSQQLIDEIKGGGISCPVDLGNKTVELNRILADAIGKTSENDELGQNLSFRLIKPNEVLCKELSEMDPTKINPYINSDFYSLNFLRLNYSSEWPLNTILTQEIISTYETLFSVFMQLLRAEILLQNVFHSLKSKKSKSGQLKRLEFYRHNFLQIVRSLRFYMNVIVVESEWVPFFTSLPKAETLESVYQLVINYIKNVSNNCLLGSKNKGEKILRLVIRLLLVIESFCASLLKISETEEIDWDNGKVMKSESFSSLKLKFNAASKYLHIFFQSLYKAADGEVFPKIHLFLQLCDFNSYHKERLENERI